MAVSSLVNLGATPGRASSHREAPLISQDPAADATDLYAYVSPDAPDTVTLIANYYPFEDPAGFPNYYSFGDDVVYRINIDNNGDAVEDLFYQFEFDTEIVNPNSFLYSTGPIESLDDENFNLRQTYTLSEGRGGELSVVADGLLVPPVNIGPSATPDYAALAEAAVAEVGDGIQVFAGQRDDPFWADLGGIGDLLTIRQLPGTEGGIDDLKGINVQTLALQVPIAQLTGDGEVPEDAAAATAVIGVWTTALRPSTIVIGDDGSRTADGDLVQVSRLGMPLVNEIVAPLGAKDLFNASVPADDAQFLAAVTDPEIAVLLNALYGDVLEEVPESGRDDLVAVFLTGVDGLNQPPDVTPSEMLRLNVAIPPADDLDPLGVIAGDNAGFPNGRRLEDEVVDIELRVAAGVLLPDLNVEPNNLLGDGVPANDVPFLDEFPYVALPHQGFEHEHHAPTADSSDEAASAADEEATEEPADEEATEEPAEEATEEPAEEEATEEPAEEEATEEPTDEEATEASDEEEAASTTIELNEVAGSGVSGIATLLDNGDGTLVSLEVEGATGDHPVHIHNGTCGELGEVVEPLTNIDEDGISETTVELGYDELLEGEFAINAHESTANIDNYIACGTIEAEAEEEATEEPAEEEATEEPADEDATEEPAEDEATEESSAADSASLDLAELDDSGISGTAELTADGDSTTVTLAVDGATGGHPVHIHVGTCSNLGDVEYPLTDIDEDGESETTVEVGLDDLLSGEYAINAHLSADEIQTYVACGNIASAS